MFNRVTYLVSIESVLIPQCLMHVLTCCHIFNCVHVSFGIELVNFLYYCLEKLKYVRCKLPGTDLSCIRAIRRISLIPGEDIHGGVGILDSTLSAITLSGFTSSELILGADNHVSLFLWSCLASACHWLTAVCKFGMSCQMGTVGPKETVWSADFSEWLNALNHLMNS